MPRAGTPGVLAGAGYVWRGLRLILRPEIRRFVVIPLLLNLVLFACGIAMLAWAIEHAIDRLLPSWLEWLRFILWPLFALLAAAVVFFGFSALANLLGSPFNSLLSAAVERHLRGRAEDHSASGWRAVGGEILRSVYAELRKLLYFARYAIPGLLLFIIPGINAFAAPIWLLFGVWMLAIEYLDCPLGNHGQPFPAARRLLQTRRRLALGFGGAITALTLIPVLNFIAMPVGVAAATALYLDHFTGAN